MYMYMYSVHAVPSFFLNEETTNNIVPYTSVNSSHVSGELSHFVTFSRIFRNFPIKKESVITLRENDK